MAKVTDHELLSLIANALHRSGPEGNPERVNVQAAYTRAAAVFSALQGAGLVMMREEPRYPRPWVNMEPEEEGGPLFSR
jgi:hypothetical protein